MFVSDKERDFVSVVCLWPCHSLPLAASYRSMSRGRSVSLAAPGKNSGLKDSKQVNKSFKLSDMAQRKGNKKARKGEGDRHIPDLKPKHLFSGKRPKGSTDRR